MAKAPCFAAAVSGEPQDVGSAGLQDGILPDLCGGVDAEANARLVKYEFV